MKISLLESIISVESIVTKLRRKTEKNTSGQLEMLWSGNEWQRSS